MPIYDFKCEECGHLHEVVCKVDERKEARKCPKCDACSYMVITGNDTGFILKGDNWDKGEAKRRWGDDTTY